VFRLDWGPLILHVQSTMRMGQRRRRLRCSTTTAEARNVKPAVSSPTTRRWPTRSAAPIATLAARRWATRTAEKIFQRYFGGEPWVGHEAAGGLDRPTRSLRR